MGVAPSLMPVPVMTNGVKSSRCGQQVAMISSQAASAA
jgi:hypothetical protein